MARSRQGTPRVPFLCVRQQQPRLPCPSSPHPHHPHCDSLLPTHDPAPRRVPRRHAARITIIIGDVRHVIVQLIMAKALYSNWLRIVWCNAGAMLGMIFRSLLCLGIPTSLHAATVTTMPPSCR